jgi:membrane protein required for colicin V production
VTFFAEFTWIDIVAIVVIAASALLSLVRGLVKEIASLAVWVVAFVGASRLSHYAAELLPAWLSPPLMQTIGFLIVLILILVVGKLVTLALKELINAAGVGLIDRTLGMFFGIARGGLLVVVLAVLAAMTSLPKDAAWQKAKTKDFLELGIRTAAPWLPQEIEQRLQIPKSVFNWKEFQVCVA